MESQENLTPLGVGDGTTQGFYEKNKKLFIGGMIALLVLVGGLWYYKQYTSSPEYIISQMLSAYTQGNVDEFEKHFDVDDFSRMLWSDYKEWWEKDKGSIWSPLRDNIDSADAVKVTIRNIAGGKKTLEDLERIEESNSTTRSMASLLENMHNYKISSVSDEGDTKKFRLIAKTYNEQEFAFDLTAKHKGDYWKICELRNVGEVCTSFKDFAKKSLISYLKEVQPTQDQYLEKVKEANTMPGKNRFDYIKKHNPETIRYSSGQLFKNATEEAVAFLETRANAERYRIAELKKIQTNPFSSILNNNRITCSQNGEKYYSLMKQWLEAGMEAKSFSTGACKDLLEQARKTNEKMEDFDSRVRGLISRVGYKSE